MVRAFPAVPNSEAGPTKTPWSDAPCGDLFLALPNLKEINACIYIYDYYLYTWIYVYIYTEDSVYINIIHEITLYIF